jgi:hypothetical protein
MDCRDYPVRLDQLESYTYQRIGLVPGVRRPAVKAGSPRRLTDNSSVLARCRTVKKFSTSFYTVVQVPNAGFFRF